MKYLLLPFAILYDLITRLRNYLFDVGVFKTHRFSLPLINVGNISVGGTGKTPHVEYLIQLLGDKYKLATLSRGYKRKSKGFVEANELTTAAEIGDEPAQFFHKYPEVRVAVDEKRVHGVKKLLNGGSGPEVILLDDAFQHRHIEAGLNILLTDYYRPYFRDYIMPSGRLRESRSFAKRADLIVVTKSPRVLNPIERKQMIQEIDAHADQKVCFSYLKYGKLKQMQGIKSAIIPQKYYSILMVSGIANPDPMEEHLKCMCTELETLKFSDHHNFSDGDLRKIRERFMEIISHNKIIVTTEKDAMRFADHPSLSILQGLPIFYLPIKVAFHKEDQQVFDEYIINYVGKNQSDS